MLKWAALLVWLLALAMYALLVATLLCVGQVFQGHAADELEEELCLGALRSAEVPGAL